MRFWYARVSSKLANSLRCVWRFELASAATNVLHICISRMLRMSISRCATSSLMSASLPRIARYSHAPRNHDIKALAASLSPTLTSTRNAFTEAMRTRWLTSFSALHSAKITALSPIVAIADKASTTEVRTAKLSSASNSISADTTSWSPRSPHSRAACTAAVRTHTFSSDSRFMMRGSSLDVSSMALRGCRITCQNAERSASSTDQPWTRVWCEA
mmetsp:Transcript_24901/g.59301  ORF Transcript_24901/g.59301 Transcript_24901/m.59301 type:complete len:216 (+) Transcript_24901:667-1314(+)